MVAKEELPGDESPPPDVREREEPARDALREAEEKYTAVFDHAPFAISLTRLSDGALVEVNDAWVKLFGYSRREAIGRNAQELGIVSDPEGRARL